MPGLLDQIPPDQKTGSVITDGAWDTRKCRDVIAARCAHAIILPHKSARPWKAASVGAIARNEAVNASRYLGRAIWRRWSGYHRRSRVETGMNCVKLLGQGLPWMVCAQTTAGQCMARDVDRPVAEIQIRTVVLNRCTPHGIPVTEAVG